MAGPEEKYLDDIGDEPAADAPQPADTGAEPPEAGTEVEIRPADDKPPRTDPANRPDRPDGYVPKQAVDRVQHELQQERQARAAAEDRFAKMVERFYKENAPEPSEQKAAPEHPGERPDPATDPYGYTIWRAKKDDYDDHQRQQAQQQNQQRSQQDQQWQQALGEVNAYFVQAKAAKPELEDLYQGIRQSFAREYAAYAEAMGQPVNPIALQQQVEKQEAQIIQWAYQNRVPIDAVIERMAAARGVTAKPPPANGDGQQRQTPDRDPATGQFVSEAEKAAKARESQERNASLSSAPGAPVKKMTPAELAKMPEEEMWRHFESLKGQKGSKNFDREMGFRS